jgi:hypothetical protein
MKRVGVGFARVIVLAVIAVLTTAPVLAATSRAKHDSDSAGPVTQTHTLFFTTRTCEPDPGGVVWTGYAFTSWNTRFQRTAGADREIAKVTYQTFAGGADCTTGRNTTRDTGIQTYYPRWGSTNDKTWTLQLNWPTIFPHKMGSVGSSTKGYYGYRSGHPGSIAATICTNVDARIDFVGGAWNACPDL